MYCFITTVPVAFYCACSDEIVHYNIGATYDDHLRLIGQLVVDFLLVFIDSSVTRFNG